MYYHPEEKKLSLPFFKIFLEIDMIFGLRTLGPKTLPLKLAGPGISFGVKSMNLAQHLQNNKQETCPWLSITADTVGAVPTSLFDSTLGLQISVNYLIWFLEKSLWVPLFLYSTDLKSQMGKIKKIAQIKK